MNSQRHTSATDENHRPAAERTTRAFLDALNAQKGPPLETLSPQEARAVLTKAQSSKPVKLAPATVVEKTISFDGCTVPLKIVRPAEGQGTLPAFLFFHGGGWVLGDFPTHERLVRDLVAESGAVAVFVDYERSPEAHYPMAITQAFAATRWVAAHGDEIEVDGQRLAVVGNSVGGNMAAVVALRSKTGGGGQASGGGPALRCQILLWPVTDARFDTPSYVEFANGHFLTREMMRWFWNSYTTDERERNDIFASPLRATLEQLKGLPPALVQTAELDVLRDEGEAYARKMDQAGVEVMSMRVNGMIHDFGLLNPLSEIPAVRAALRMAGQELKRRLE